MTHYGDTTMTAPPQGYDSVGVPGPEVSTSHKISDLWIPPRYMEKLGAI